MKFHYKATTTELTLYLGETDDIEKAIHYADNAGTMLKNCHTYIEDSEGRLVVECTLVDGLWTKVWVDNGLLDHYGKAIS